jgi:hypothetical protein
VIGGKNDQVIKKLITKKEPDLLSSDRHHYHNSDSNED